MGMIFGAYISEEWRTCNNWVEDHTAYIFSVSKRTRHPVIVAGHAIRCRANYGATFGSGNDIHICDNADQNNSHARNFGKGYEAPHGCPNPSTYLAGATTFRILDIEVFTVTRW
jgi:hypothetical protein